MRQDHLTCEWRNVSNGALDAFADPSSLKQCLKGALLAGKRDTPETLSTR